MNHYRSCTDVSCEICALQRARKTQGVHVLNGGNSERPDVHSMVSFDTPFSREFSPGIQKQMEERLNGGLINSQTGEHETLQSKTYIRRQQSLPNSPSRGEIFQLRSSGYNENEVIRRLSRGQELDRSYGDPSASKPGLKSPWPPLFKPASDQMAAGRVTPQGTSVGLRLEQKNPPAAWKVM